MIKKIFFLLLIFAITGLAVVYFFGSSILSKSVRKGVVTFGPKITQTSVQLDDVDLSVLSGDGKLSGLYVGNPEGFTSENIFALNQIEIDIAPKSLLSDQIVINKIHIRKPKISYEKTLRSSNLKELLKNIEGSSEGPDSPDKSKPKKDSAAEEKPAKQVLIKELIIEDGSVFVGILGVGTEVLLPRIEMYDLGKSDGKNDVASILKSVLDEVLKFIIPAVQQQGDSIKSTGESLINSIVEPGNDAVKKANDQINKLIPQKD